MSAIKAVILAGGRAQRMGGDDKGLVTLNDKPMIEHVIDRIQGQVADIMINANRNQAKYARYGYLVFTDNDSGFLGPLAGIVSALNHCDADTQYLITLACDCPLLPLDLVARMQTALEQQQADLAVASDGQRQQPVIMLLKPSLRQSMQAFLDGGDRKIDLWYRSLRVAEVSFADQPQAFVNVNTPEQKQQLAATLHSMAK
ncbi:molybdenum cofactor guanylyltransferase MobA [Shewanella sp. NIFS-20-20]|uniref:molybdenum cofactor guanylyltransferase MobA n=1 Tax=Shewanella sp. NIFS-20-20 TaxID=2853806 RepID=UPI001C4728C4|nr:molybdenum cofactor guanylyltransferase MobA [Shewanella sp. NIFS-20-20]MBV7316043.1 molybdenum cofactor guanylyltransferase [Shewanella sp. NIFS-20-20]